MIRNLLATTAVVALMSGVAAAQTTTPAQPNAGAPPASAQPDSMKQQDSMNKDATGSQSQAGFTASPQDFKSGSLWLASNLTGASVYDTKADNAQKIGSINDLIIAEGGKVDDAILGIGGFLGLGQKNVSVKFSQLQISSDTNGKMTLALPMSQEELKAMPDYVDPDAQASRSARPAGAQNNATTNRMARDAMGRASDADANRGSGATGSSANQASGAMTKVTRVSADQLIGASVVGAANEDIGDVNDVVVAKDGSVKALIVDVGGFLGMGEKPVALAYDQFQIGRADGNSTDLKLTAAINKQSLQGMSAFDKAEMTGTKRDTSQPGGAARTPGAGGLGPTSPSGSTR